MSAAIAMTVAAVQVYNMPKGEWMAYVTFENIGATRHQKPTLEVWSPCGLDAPPKVGDVLMVMPPRVVGRAGGGEGGDGREAVAPCSALDLGRLINSVPADVLKKISLHDIHRIAKNYNGESEPKDARGTVFARSECLFHYCPHSEMCRDGCACPSRPNSQAQPRVAGDVLRRARDSVSNELLNGRLCPDDTDGDGDCGRPACPVCGQRLNGEEVARE